MCGGLGGPAPRRESVSNTLATPHNSALRRPGTRTADVPVPGRARRPTAQHHNQHRTTTAVWPTPHLPHHRPLLLAAVLGWWWWWWWYLAGITNRHFPCYTNWPCGPMDKASDYESGDCRFESCQGQTLFGKYYTEL